MKFCNTYNVRSSEISPEFLMKDYFAGMYFQECFAEYCAARKVAGYDISELGLTWLTSDNRAEFFQPMPFWRSEVKITTWIYKRTPVRIFVNFTAESEGRKIAQGSAIQLIADAKSHRPQRVDLVADKFDLDPETIFDNDDFGKIEMFDNGCCSTEGMNSITQVVRFDDLDFNMHLNNVRYIPRGLEAIDVNYRLCHRLKSYRIKYEKEAKFGDEIESIVTRRGDDFSHLLRRSCDGEQICQMYSHWEPR